ncbi:MAG: FAD-dependent oxidoreductase [Verrucomicrobiaceae bacterium]|nr:FAD-dependent oxidoreductase [Verrucomicrobiaceae bacterium]
MANLSRREFFTKTATLGALGYSMAIYAPIEAEAKGVSSKYYSSKKINSGVKNESALYSSKIIKCDVLVAGGGLAGVCAAISAARNGAKVVLVQNRSRLGGNSSSEIRMHPLGVFPEKTGWREGGIMEELRIENSIRNVGNSWEQWDLLLYDKCVSEPNITLLLDTTLCATEVSGKLVKKAFARCDLSRTLYEIIAKTFIDCTGDCSLAMESGAEVMSGREGSKKYGESLADFDKIGTHQGSSIMLTTKVCDRPVAFKAPAWVRKMSEKDFKFRRPRGKNLDYGFWWIELGGDADAIADNEKLRFELLRVVLGVWDYIKNSGKYPEADNRALDFVGMLPGRRDTFRIVGRSILTQHDIEKCGSHFTDAVCVGGWSLDDHPAEGFNASDRHPCQQIRKTFAYNIPFSILCSKDFDNLMMAGRNVSCSHVAFTSTRVMATCAVMGQAVGTASALGISEGKTIAEISQDKDLITKLQQILLRDDQTILGLKNTDLRDIAPRAKISASASSANSHPTNVVSGIDFDSAKSLTNSWQAKISTKPEIKFEWDLPQKVSQVRIKSFTGAFRLSMSEETYVVAQMKRNMPNGMPPEMICDFDIVGVIPSGEDKLLASVRGNVGRLCVCKFSQELLKEVRIKFLSTYGSDFVQIQEIRIEA